MPFGVPGWGRVWARPHIEITSIRPFPGVPAPILLERLGREGTRVFPVFRVHFVARFGHCGNGSFPGLIGRPDLFLKQGPFLVLAQFGSCPSVLLVPSSGLQTLPWTQSREFSRFWNHLFSIWENQTFFFVFSQWHWNKVFLICRNNLGFSCRSNKEGHDIGNKTFCFPREQDSSYWSPHILDRKDGEVNGQIG